MKLKAQNFSYNDGITVVSKKQFDVHKNLYNGYVAKANEISSILSREREWEGNATYSPYRALGKAQSYALDGIILHELYFSNFGRCNSNMCNELEKAIAKCFGSRERWLMEFKACADSAKGWAILAYEQRSKSLINMLQDSHDDGVVMGVCPLIVLDMYEHAYYIDYASNKNEYFDKFMDNIKWAVVNQRFKEIMGHMNAKG